MRATSRSGRSWADARSSRRSRHADRGSRGRPARRLPQQDGPAVLGEAQAERRQRGRVRLRQSGRRKTAKRRTYRPDAARPVPEVQVARVRDRQFVRLREGGRPGQDVRLPLGPHDPAAADRARADAQAPEGRKTDLLQFVSARTRRPFSAFLVVQPDGKVGFEFEAKDPAKARGPRRSMALRVLGAASEGQAARRAARRALRSLREARRR